MTGMYGHVKMIDGERICNLSVSIVQDGHEVVEVMKYDADNQVLDVNYTALDSISWPGNIIHMAGSQKTDLQGMRCYSS